MGFETPFSIQKALDRIINKEYVLPDIQRRFIWSRNQIERMFDSIMMGYPLGNLLLWEIEGGREYDLKFYEFMKEHYDGMNKENPDFNLKKVKGNKLAVMDGQQRLTALYIGFKGAYYIKQKGVSRDCQESKNYTKYDLYVKLSSPTDEESKILEEETMNYRFEFLSERDNKENFIKVSDFCSEGLQRSLYDDKENKEHCKNKLYELLKDEEHREYAHNFIIQFQNKMKEHSFVSYKEEKKSTKEEKKIELDTVAEVFVRSNSGGTALTKSDILLSVATAHWDTKDLEHDNAREEIAEFIKKINKKGFNFDTDFIMKSCLVIAEVSNNIKLKIENFSKQNMQEISTKWKEIKETIETTVDLTSNLGFAQGRRLTSNNILIPIAYYFSKINCQINEKDKEKIIKWIVHAILKSTFRSSSDTMLKVAIGAIGETPNSFDWTNLKAKFENVRSIRFYESDIENILDDESFAKAFSVLSVLYPNSRLENLIVGKYELHNLEVDHVFSKKLLKHSEFKKFMNRAANLQFLTADENNKKSDNMPNDWCKNYIKKLKIVENEWKERNYMWNKKIPDMSGFLDFYNDRRSRMKKELMKILEVSQGEAED